jgi:hypothetical protein
MAEVLALLAEQEGVAMPETTADAIRRERGARRAA